MQHIFQNRKIMIISIITVVVLALFGSFIIFRNQGEETKAADWFNENWYYRKTIELNNSTSTLTNFQVKILDGEDLSADINAGKIQSDLGDLRFTDAGGNLLDYWIEDNASSSVDVWIKVPNLPSGNSTIYMYYGNPSAESLSNGDNVFEFFDDFEGSSLNSGKWTVYQEGGGNFSVADSKLTISGDTRAHIISKDLGITAPFVMHTYVNGKGISNWDLNPTGYATDNGNWTKWVLWSDTGIRFGSDWSNFNGSYTGIDGRGWSDTSCDSFYQFTSEIFADGTSNIKATSTVYSTSNTNTPNANRIMLAYWDTGTNECAQGRKFDWVFVRKYEVSEPTVGSPTTEEQGPGPVGYWSFDEGHGSTAYDQSPNNNDGTITGATWKPESECRFGKCLYFDGSGDYVRISNTNNEIFPANNEAFSISLWFKANDVLPTSVHSIMNNETYTVSGFRYGINSSSKLAFWSSESGGGINIISNQSIKPNNWYHAEIVYTGSSAKMYINGVEDNEDTSGTVISNTNTIKIAEAIGGKTAFPGYIDEVKIYNYARTAEQIKQDYNRGKSVVMGGNENSSLNNGLVGWWKMDESAANSCSGGINDACDSSGNGNDGAWNGDASATSTAKFGRAVEFDGDGDYIEFSSINPGRNGTVSGWFYLNSTSNMDIYGDEVSSKGMGFQVYNGSFYSIVSDGAPHRYSVGVTPQANTWYHVVQVFNENNTEVYINGELVRTSNYVLKNQTNRTFKIGNSSGGSYAAGYFDGIFDELRIYNRALSPEEVRRLYEWAPGPVAYYPMEEASGTTVHDISGNNYDLAFSTGMDASRDWVHGKFGSGIYFPYSAGRVEKTSGFPDISSAFTLSAWVKLDENSDSSNYFISLNNSIRLSKYNSGNVDCAFNQGGWDSLSSGVTLPKNEWHYLTCTYDGTTRKIYFDGILKNSDTFTENVTVDDIRLGWQDASASISGILDDVKIYNYARTPRQILEDMNAGRKNNPIAYWSFDEGQGTTAYDQGLTKQITGTGYDGTLTNMSTSGTSTAWTKFGKKGGALKFDGTNDSNVTLGGESNLRLSSYSISAWVKPQRLDSLSGNDRLTIISKWNGSGGTQVNYDLAIKSDKTFYVRHSNSTTYSFTSNKLAKENEWQQVIVTYDDRTNRLALYIDGELDKEATASVDPYTGSTANPRIGAFNFNWNLYHDEFIGVIDEVKIYNYPLTLDEIRQNYNQGRQTVLSKSKEEVQAVTEGLVGWWKMDESSWSGNSGEVIDYSGAGNNGTAYGGASTTSTAKYGRAGEFDGVDDYVDIVNSISYPDNLTISGWFKTSVTGSNQTIFFATSNNGADRIQIRVHNTNVLNVLTDNSADWPSYDIMGSINVVDGDWHYFTFIQKGKNLYLYIDGKLDTSQKIAVNSPFLSTDNKIGYYISGNEQVFNGQIDDVKIYNYARTPEQIMQDYVEGPPPVGYWKFDEMEGSTAVDFSGQGNDGTITGATWEVRGKKGSALQFDGVDDYAYVNTTDFAFINSSNMSISFWVKFNSYSTANYRLIAYGQDSQNAWQLVGYSGPACSKSNANTFVFEVSKNGTKYGAGLCGSEYIVGRWYHVVGTFDDSTNTSKIYVDGKLVSGSGAALGLPTDYNTLYFPGGGVFDPFPGVIDEVKIYNYALTPRQVAYEYNGGKPIAYYKFDKGEGGAAYDYSGNSNDGTIYPGTGGTNTSTSTMWSNGTAGKINGSLDFDGTDDYVLGSSNLGISGDAEFTMMAWMKWTGSSWSSNYPSIMGNNSTGVTGQGLSLTVKSGRPALDFWNNRFRADDALETNTWYHIAVTKTPGNISDHSKIYVNGEEVPGSLENSNTAPNITDSPPVVGRLDGTRWFEGLIDEAKFFNYALTPEEIKREYNAGFGIRFK